MSQEQPFRSRLRSARASRISRNKRRLRDSRTLRLERLEQRSLLAGMITGLEGGAGDLLSAVPEGESSPSTVVPRVDVDAPTFKYIPPKYYQAKQGEFLTGPASGTPLAVATNFLRANAADLGLTADDINHLIVKSQNTSSLSGATSIYFKQTYNGLEIANADVNISLAKDGQIISVGSTALGGLTYPSSDQALTVGTSTLNAFKEFGKDFGINFSTSPSVLLPAQGRNQRTVLSGGGATAENVTAELQYIATASGPELTWKMIVPTADRLHWYESYQGADDGRLVFVSDWIDNASYNVLPLPNESPSEGGRAVLVDPHDPVASPYGWHDLNGQPGAEFLDTRGNNVTAQEDISGQAATGGASNPTQRPSGGTGLNFNDPLNLQGTPSTYTNASVTNLFYVTNMAHDVFYRYGFDEASGNFQAVNYSGLGKGGDAVLALSQSGGALGLATGGPRMGTGPEGTRPLLIMTEINADITALFSPTLPLYGPARDSSFQNDVIIHEFGHGVTNRLVGGPNNVIALNATQSDALGEGWSDFFGFWFTQRASDLPNNTYASGTYLGGPSPLFPDKGVRRFPYSFDTTKNPLTFGEFNGAGGAACNTITSNCESHNAGEIWAQTLIDLNWILRGKYGFSANLFDGQAGNNLTMKLVVEALKLTPVNPTFLNARDAILQADLILHRGVNHKEIWQAFARRGMGFSADSDTLDLGVSPGVGGPVFIDSPLSTSVREAFDSPANPSKIRGRVFSDANGNGVLDGNETGIGGVTIFIDVDNDGILEPLEPTTITAADGSYEFELFVRGEFRIGQVVPAGQQQTTPAGIGGQVVTINNGQTINNVNFGNRNGNALSTGVVFRDFDGNGRREEDEPGMAGVVVYADYDGDKRLDLGEPQATTDADGNYSLRLDRTGTYVVRQSVPAGFVQSVPANNQGFTVTIVSGSLNANFEFGNTSAEDWGDAPDSYRTLAASDGAVHGWLPGFYLGTSVDLESDGIPSADATGDDVSPILLDDENGVQFTSSLFPGASTTLAVTVNLKDRKFDTVNGRPRTTILQDNSAGRLHAWVDFNRDGDFSDAGEKVFNDLLLLEGTHNLSFTVPANAVTGATFARFRYGYEHELGPHGRATAGEVEDYLVRILSETPDAVDDVFSVGQNTTANQFDVLANDVASSKGPLSIASVTASARGATIVISPDGLSLRYTPQRGSIGNDSFRYTVRDPAGAVDTAEVSVTILPSLSQPLAVDDSVTVNENSTNNIINVMANDLTGRFPPIGIVFPGAPANGTVTVDNRGTVTPTDDVLRYTPNAGFSGTEQFQYTIEDTSLQQSTATVTVHVQPGDSDDDIVQYRLEATDINNRPIQAIGVGETFKIRAYVKDLRPDDTVDDGVDRRGVGAAYFDALYPFALVSLQGSLSFSGSYNNATSGNISTPGLINEGGALRTDLPPAPTGGNEFLVYEVMATATGVGRADFIGDPADQTSENPGSPDHDTILFEPPQNAVTTRQLRFINSALQIVGTGARPVATDNTFTVPANAASFPLNVLANDIDRINPPLRISAVGSALSTVFTTPNGSIVTISPDGQLLRYTPRNGFNGTEQFSYTVSNAVNLTATATVTVQVGTPTKDVTIRLEATNLQGQPLTGPIAVGDDFLVRVLVQDIRANPPDRTRMGVFASYLDLLYDSGLVSTIGDLANPFGFRLQFGSAFDANGLSASNTFPNVIDELGAFQSSFGPLGPNEFLLAAVTFNADRAGTATFVSDPADITPLHDVLLFEPDDASVPLSRINFRTTSVTIGGSGEGEFHNRLLPADVNGDGLVTPIDPLVVINNLNQNGSRYLLSSAAAEGEASNRILPDVNGDGWLTPIDALQAINAVSSLDNGAPEGEAAATQLLADSTAIAHSARLLLSPAARLEADNRTSVILGSLSSSREGSHETEVMATSSIAIQRDTKSTREKFFAEFQSSQDDNRTLEDALAEDIGNEWWQS